MSLLYCHGQSNDMATPIAIATMLTASSLKCCFAVQALQAKEV